MHIKENLAQQVAFFEKLLQYLTSDEAFCTHLMEFRCLAFNEIVDTSVLTTFQSKLFVTGRGFLTEEKDRLDFFTKKILAKSKFIKKGNRDQKWHLAENGCLNICGKSVSHHLF